VTEKPKEDRAMMFDDACGAATAEAYGLSLDDPGARKRIEAVRRSTRALRRYLEARPTPERLALVGVDDGDLVTLASMAGSATQPRRTR
jgi:hypothetical protein